MSLRKQKFKLNKYYVGHFRKGRTIIVTDNSSMFDVDLDFQRPLYFIYIYI